MQIVTELHAITTPTEPLNLYAALCQRTPGLTARHRYFLVVAALPWWHRLLLALAGEFD